MNEGDHCKCMKWRLAAPFLILSVCILINGCCRKDNLVNHEEQTTPGKHLVLIRNYTDTM
jgi:hypothetical protein